VENTKPRTLLGLVCLTVFIDIVGFSIIFPLFPAMLEHYLALEGPASWIGGLAGRLDRLAGSDSNAVATLFGGLLGSLYSVLQFLFAPVWGGLSDRVGRRPTMLITLTGTVASYVLWIFSGSFVLLVGARLLGGMMAGNISTASAIVADVTSGAERAKGMGLIGASIGLGFIFGPAIGGFAWQARLGGPPWSAGFALNPFSVPALIACALAAVNLLWFAARFKETYTPGESAPGARSWNPFAQLARLRFPGLARTNLVYFLFLTVFSAMEFTLVFLAAERLGYDPGQNTWMFVFVGLLIALVQGGFVRRLAPRLGEKRLTLAGLAGLIPGFALIGLAQSTPVLYAGLFFMAVGSALAMPCLSSLVSRYTPLDRQGLALGTFRSLGALSRALGPIAGGVLYWKLGSAAPYYSGAVFLLLPLALAAGLPPLPADAQPSRDGRRTASP
jgi:MFS family permease